MSIRTQEIEAWLGQELPETYRAFLADVEVEQAVGDVLLYGSDIFIERNETFETRIYCPGYAAIGSDGGGRQLLLALKDGSISIVDDGVMTPDMAQGVSFNFAIWLSAGCPLYDEDV